MGDALLPLATSFAVLGAGGSAAELAVVLVASRIATPAVVLLGGVFGDILSRLAIMRYADLCRVLLQVATGAIFLTSGIEFLWLIALLQFLSGAAAGFFEPAANGYLPTVVPQESLQSANSWLSILRNITGIVAQPVAALAVIVFEPGVAFYLSAVVYSLSFVLLLKLSSGERTAEGGATPLAVWKQLVEGLGHLLANRWILISAVQLGLLNACAMAPLFVLGPLVAESSMDGAQGWAIVMFAFGVGSLIGGLLALKLRPKRPMLFALGLGALSAPVLALMALEPNVALIAPAAALAGAQGSITNIIVMTVIQQRTPLEKLSRVSSVLAVASLVMLPMGMGVVGFLAEGVGGFAVLVGSGAIVLIATALTCFAPAIWRIRSTDPLNRESASSSDAGKS